MRHKASGIHADLFSVRRQRNAMLQLTQIATMLSNHLYCAIYKLVTLSKAFGVLHRPAESEGVHPS